MFEPEKKPLLLLENSELMSVINQGEFKASNLSFEEARAILDMHGDDDVVKCFTDTDIEYIIFNYLGISRRDYPYENVTAMLPGQDAIVFKLYVTPSETQPIIHTDSGIEAKKIRNIYAYCQFITRIN